VIPICGRILHFAEKSTIPKKSAFRLLPNYSEADRAVRSNLYRYSRPMQDVSTYLILYPSLHTPALVCPTSIFESDGYCTRKPTPKNVSPHSMSETYDFKCWTITRPDIHPAIAEFMGEVSNSRHLVGGKPNGSNADVVDCLLDAWNKDVAGEYKKEWTENGHKVRYLWQELKNMMNTGPDARNFPPSWPAE